MSANDSSPVAPGRRCTTTTCSIDGHTSIALSELRLRGTMVPRRYPPSAVMSTLHCESLRRSQGSPSQISAALLRLAPLMCRSTQLTETLILPPTNHLECGGVHSHTV